VDPKDLVFLEPLFEVPEGWMECTGEQAILVDPKGFEAPDQSLK
jgi:hypothetical protein